MHEGQTVNYRANVHHSVRTCGVILIALFGQLWSSVTQVNDTLCDFGYSENTYRIDSLLGFVIFMGFVDKEENLKIPPYITISSCLDELAL